MKHKKIVFYSDKHKSKKTFLNIEKVLKINNTMGKTNSQNININNKEDNNIKKEKNIKNLTRLNILKKRNFNIKNIKTNPNFEYNSVFKNNYTINKHNMSSVEKVNNFYCHTKGNSGKYTSNNIKNYINMKNKIYSAKTFLPNDKIKNLHLSNNIEYKSSFTNTKNLNFYKYNLKTNYNTTETNKIGNSPIYNINLISIKKKIINSNIKNKDKNNNLIKMI